MLRRPRLWTCRLDQFLLASNGCACACCAGRDVWPQLRQHETVRVPAGFLPLAFTPPLLTSHPTDPAAPSYSTTYPHADLPYLYLPTQTNQEQKRERGREGGREGEREREKDRKRQRQRESGAGAGGGEGESERQRERERQRGRDRERERETERERERERRGRERANENGRHSTEPQFHFFLAQDGLASAPKLRFGRPRASILSILMYSRCFPKSREARGEGRRGEARGGGVGRLNDYKRLNWSIRETQALRSNPRNGWCETWCHAVHATLERYQEDFPISTQSDTELVLSGSMAGFVAVAPHRHKADAGVQ